VLGSEPVSVSFSVANSLSVTNELGDVGHWHGIAVVITRTLAASGFS